MSELPPFHPSCPMSTVPVRVGGKWTAMLLLCLADEPRRFGVLRRHLRPISAKVLSESLAIMERDGLVTRAALADGVEYALTDMGRSLLPLIEHTRAWVRDHLPWP